MKKNVIAAVICEYNPFHLGHEYLFARIREDIGKEGTILAVMSGNFTQRGEAALFDKYLRAEAALRCGADAVFELPFPFSAAGAEFFAEGGVRVAAALGADRLYFGAETPDLAVYETLADLQNSPTFSAMLSERLASHPDRSYAAVREELLREQGMTVPNTPNDILASEYVRAIRKIGCNMIPCPVLRIGAGYHDSAEQKIMSASGIRIKLRAENILLSIPEKLRPLYENAVGAGNYTPADLPEDAILSFFRLMRAEMLEPYFGLGSGLAYRFRECAKESDSLPAFYAGLATKKYTDAHLHRTVLGAMIGVTYADLTAMPLYTQLLAMHSRVGFLIRQAKLPVVTKPANYIKLSESARKQYELGIRADNLYTLSLKTKKPAGEYLRRSPMIAGKK